jgi:hypothetical protein
MDKKQIGEKLKSLKGLLPAGHLVGAGLGRRMVLLGHKLKLL